MFKKYDIEQNGRIGVNGINRAPMESFLNNVLVFFDCVLFGYIIKLMLDQDAEDFHYSAYQTYWLIIDMIVMFCFQPYMVICAKFQLNGEITKNLYSMQFVQTKKIKEIKYH